MEQNVIDKEDLILADTPPYNRVNFNKVFNDLITHYSKRLKGSEILKLYPILIDTTEAYLLSKFLDIYLDIDLQIDLAAEVIDLHKKAMGHAEKYFEKNEPITVYQISDYYEFPVSLAREIFEKVIDMEDEPSW